MAKTDYQSVDDYIAQQPEGSRKILERVRAVIRSALPDASEVISYQIPAYKMPGGTAVYFAGWKKHYSIYPMGERLVAECKDELDGYELSKGTLRLPLSEPVPEALIARIAKFRAAEVEEMREARKGNRK